ncbi:MAG: hypothetical protein HFP78_04020 [Methylococcales symbiont of Hymedesmia sp. n. MRB-2018]|nr:MAG: hypothetical protein HFP78_04020 [Methylococcales symbiont of Hymedesmia sp. n. MRB-2018]
MVEQESYYLTLLRYIEANAFRANLSKKAQDWCYGSLAERVFKNRTLLHEPYIQLDNWVDYVNIPQTQKELDKVRNSVNRQAPIGSKDWVVKNSAEIWFIINLESKRNTEKREKVMIKVACLYTLPPMLSLALTQWFH